MHIYNGVLRSSERYQVDREETQNQHPHVTLLMRIKSMREK